MPPALDGILVADFSRVLAGPLCTMTLADLGADVVKVERPGTGDDTRQWGPPFVEEGATYYLGLNRNKRSLVLDLDDAADVALAGRLAARADVVVESFRPGLMARWGLGNRHPSIAPYETFRAADGELAIACGNDAIFARLCAALGVPELATDPRFAANSARLQHRDELGALLEARLVTLPAAEWVVRLTDAGVPAGPINDIAQAFALATELGLEPVAEVDGVRTVRSPLRLSQTPVEHRRRPPRLGEHDAELRAWLSRDG